MRILQIRFKNLNSLVGEWFIDLTHPAFVGDGIFAITGPTGAGKSTILDAICLALYGRTPRLNKITKSANEIMSRQTGECFAEVTFKTHNGVFRCHWSQHRARKKPDGDLQNPKHEIANADTGQIVEAKLKGVADKIETATGMDFERFTRSMLLAQGGFAAFLQAAPDDRAPILEQITGTEIYSHISMRVHERRGQERKTLELLNAEFDGMQILSEQDVGILEDGLVEKSRRESLLGAEVNEKNTAIQWLQNVEHLEKELAKLQDDKRLLYDKLNAFLPEQSRLDLANLALELSSEYTSLRSGRKQLSEWRNALEQCRNDLPTCISNNNEAIKAAELAERASAELKSEQQRNAPVIQAVRELNVTILERKKALDVLSAEVFSLNSAIAKTNAELESSRQQQVETQLAFESVQQQLDASANDKTLVEQLTGLNSRFQNLKTVLALRNKKESELVLASRTDKDAQIVLDSETNNVQKLSAALRSIEVEGQEKAALLTDLLEQQEMNFWREKNASIRDQNKVVESLLTAIEEKTLAEKERQTLTSDMQRCISEKAALNENLIRESEKGVAFERERDLLLDQSLLLKRIDELESLRHQLKDDEPCPLCGAEQHPYAEGNIPSANGTQRKLHAANTNCKASSEKVSQLKIEIASLEKDENQLGLLLQKTIQQANQAVNFIAEHSATITIPLGDDHSDTLQKNALLKPTLLKPRLLKYKKDNEQQIVDISQKLALAETLEKERQALRESFATVREQVAASEKAHQNAVSRKERAFDTLQRCQGELNECETQQQALLTSLAKEVEPFGVRDLSVESIEGTLVGLTLRRDTWVATNKQKATLETTLYTLAMNIDHAAATFEKDKLSFETLTQKQVLIERDITDLSNKRIEIFGNKNVDEEEQRLARAAEHLGVAEKTARIVLSETREVLLVLNNRIEELEKNSLALSRELEKNTSDFYFKLQQSGFTDEAHYVSAILNEGERKQLAEASQTLGKQKTEIDIKCQEKEKILEIEQGKKITDQPIAGLKEIYSELLESQRLLQQDIGGIKAKLLENNRLKENQKSKITAIEAQRTEIKRWDLLHELIGSADGKKYRNFAQGLTFEMMVGHANQQLKKMTDRYLLIRDEAQPLELNVIDNYQAGEVRSTKNLSGGESFIVSLALALGLSCMASKNVLVDSLFLDEGFGTLDEDALETALETLAGLHQEGKLIGVISHVGALKERIGTQIQVIPALGGRSRISGPGCRPHD